MICESNDGFPFDWFLSLCDEFNRKWHPTLRYNTDNHKEYVFTNFVVNIKYVSERGKNTTFLVYSKHGENKSYSARSPLQKQRPTSTVSKNTSTKELMWYEIDYTEDEQDVYGMQSVGHFSATSSPSIFGSRTYSDAFHSALKRLQKKAAKKGARILLVTYKSN